MSASEGAYGSQRLALRQRMPPRQSFSFYHIQRPCLRVYDKMSFYLDSLFHQPAHLRPETLSLEPSRHERSVTASPGGLWAEDADDEELRAKYDEEARLHATVASLSQQVKNGKTKAEEQCKIIEDLDREISKDVMESDLPKGIIRRLNRLESEVARLHSENTQLKDTLKTIEYENVHLGNQNDGKTRKLKGANKKVRKAKDVAMKEEDKAKGAQGDKQRLLASERRMKKERDDALAALQEQRKLNGDLLAKLQVEQSGSPHMRGAATDPNNTTAVIPIQFDICRTDVQRMMMLLEWHQINMTERFREWYKEWKTAAREVRKVAGSEDVDGEKKKLEKLYGDIIEMSNGYVETGAEHDGWCSKRAAQAVCRHAEARLSQAKVGCCNTD